MESFIKKIKGKTPYLSFFEDGSYDFYQENIDDALVKAKNCDIFSKDFFRLCKKIKSENGVAVYSAIDPNLTGIDGLCKWEDGYNHILHDLFFKVVNIWGNNTFIVCDETGFCLGKYGGCTSRESIVIRFL